MRIAFVGAPGSGKSTFSARLYAELLENGLTSTRLVTEYAQEWLGQGKIIDFEGQKEITKIQLGREEYTEGCGFSPTLCDSGLWLGAVYREYWLEKNIDRPRYTNADMEYMYETIRYINRYDMTIYVPMWKNFNEAQSNEFRIHDSEDSRELDQKILHSLQKYKIDYHKVPRKLSDREYFVKIMASEIIDNMDSHCEKVNLL